jgi:hypothetical protein
MEQAEQFLKMATAKLTKARRLQPAVQLLPTSSCLDTFSGWAGIYMLGIDHVAGAGFTGRVYTATTDHSMLLYYRRSTRRRRSCASRCGLQSAR